MMKRIFIIIFIFTLVVGLKWTPVQAYDLPSVNLGFTSFVDGIPPAGPGHYFTQYVQFWTSKRFVGSKNNSALPNSADEELKAYIGLTQYVYQSDQPVLFGGKWGIDVIIPLVYLDMEYDVSHPAFPQDNSGGVGDILIGPLLQWDPIMGEKGPIFVHRIELQMIFPTGKYDDDRELNPGSNFFSFNPYWSGTLFLGPKWTVTTRIHYLWNDKNNDPNRGFGGADDTQAGQAIHANFAASYDLLPKQLRVGINGYYLKQITDTKMNGHDVSGRREQVLGIGPGLLYSFSRDNHLFFNTYFETATKHRPEGTRINLRWVYHF